MAIFFASVSTASAATVLLTDTHTYGVGQYDPSGTDVLSPGYVTVSDQSAGRFADTFSLAGLAPGSVVTGLDLVLTFASAGPSCPLGICGIGEVWSVRAIGSATGSGDDYFATILDILSPQTFSMSAATDTGTIDAFANALATGQFQFWFSESSLGPDSFRLQSATLNVLGDMAPVPLPATAPLLLAAMGGLAFLKRRSRQMT